MSHIVKPTATVLRGASYSRAVTCWLTITWCFSSYLRLQSLAAQEGGVRSHETGAIEGVVLNATTGEPIRKAIVTLQKMTPPAVPTQNASTDVSGRFAFDDVEPGVYGLEATRKDYLRKPGEGGEVVVLPPARHICDIAIKLRPASVLSGKVVDEDGDPIMGAQIQLLRSTYVNGQRQLDQASNSTTNDLGEYRVINVQPGRYYVSAEYNGHERAFREAYPPVYYPGTSDPDDAVPLVLSPGQETSGIDLTIVSARAVRIRGRVVTPEPNAGGDNVDVTLVRRGGTALQNYGAQVGPDGTFEFSGVTAGSYDLVAAWLRISRLGEQTLVNPQPLIGHARLEVGDADLDNVLVAVGPGVDISGRVLAENGENRDLEGVRIGLQPHDMTWRRIEDVSVGANGVFALEGVLDGSYRIKLSGLPKDFYVKSARLGGADALDSPITVSGSQSLGPLDVLVSADGGHIAGTVMSHGHPYKAATVVLVPDGRQRNAERLYMVSQDTDVSGHFVLGGVVPGDYKLFAWDQLLWGSWYDPEFVRPFDNRGKSVRVDAGSTLNVQLEMISVEEGSQ